MNLAAHAPQVKPKIVADCRIAFLCSGLPAPNWLPHIRVPDVGAAVERVKAGGGQLLNGPLEVPGGDLVAQCMDPQGAMFALHLTAQGS